MLTTKQEIFVHELVKGKSQREAYKTAFDTGNMKDRSIDNKASELFKRDDIRSRYDELMEEVKSKDMIDAETIRKQIIDTEMAIVKASMGDLFDVMEDEEGTGFISKPKSDLSKFDMRAVKSYRYDSRGRLILELYDKQPAINTLKELYGLSTQEEKEDIKIILSKADGYDV